MSAKKGSSPLTRGKPLIGAKGTPSVGLIPAHAGKTPILVFYRFQAEGSSPLTRGKPSETVRQGIRRRLIPAHAGKTASRAQSAASRRAHPRSRGENELVRRGGGRGHGSSPLTRGKLGVGVGVDHVGGLIPAHAGKTYGRARGASPTRAHPRSRGENRDGVIDRLSIGGSSPLTRGKHWEQLYGDYVVGLIPAHAGKTG